jgi:hypothetical protein
VDLTSDDATHRRWVSPARIRRQTMAAMRVWMRRATTPRASTEEATDRYSCGSGVYAGENR